MEIRTLRAEEIECRVGTISGRGCSLLLYKDARCDMNILDEVFGSNNWQRDHKELKGNIYCGISIWDNEKKQWVTKWDCGKESYTESEKGEASDSFKRAGFNVGIGRELYSSPFIWIMPRTDMKPYNVKDVDGKEANEFYGYKKDNYNNLVYTTKTSFQVKEIGYDENRKINKLTIVDNKGNVRFEIATQEEQKEKLTLMSKLNELLDETGTDRKAFYDYYKVESNAQMTTEQLKDGIKKLERKLK